jgi:hypothetical protein
LLKKQRSIYHSPALPISAAFSLRYVDQLMREAGRIGGTWQRRVAKRAGQWSGNWGEWGFDGQIPAFLAQRARSRRWPLAFFSPIAPLPAS